MIAKVVKMQKGMEEMTNEELFVLYQDKRGAHCDCGRFCSAQEND